MRSESYQQTIVRWENEARAWRSSSLRMTAVFVAVFFSLQFAWASCRGTAIERLLIDTLTVTPAAWLIDLVWPAYGASAQSHSIVSAAGRLNVLNGCEGLELVFLLTAAFAAYPMPWHQRAIGSGLGIALAYIANQGRLTALWYTFAHDRSLFGLLHGTVAPLVLVALCLLYFMLFISRDTVRTG
jgi:exosortase/archaeosortase family protein